jgi:phosphoribosyl 1,2-cyclic phosphate phosphodiesterase
MLEGLDTLILDALRFEPHPTHFSLSEALAVIERLRPRRAYLTHLSHAFNHAETESTLPPCVALAYDGLTLDF